VISKTFKELIIDRIPELHWTNILPDPKQKYTLTIHDFLNSPRRIKNREDYTIHTITTHTKINNLGLLPGESMILHMPTKSFMIAWDQYSKRKKRFNPDIKYDVTISIIRETKKKIRITNIQLEEKG